jgi:hypothetical protein
MASSVPACAGAWPKYRTVVWDSHVLRSSVSMLMPSSPMRVSTAWLTAGQSPSARTTGFPAPFFAAHAALSFLARR